MVSRADLAEVFFRQTVRPASSAGRGSENTPRFSLEAVERKPAAPARPTSRRDEAAAARSEAGRADKREAARPETTKTERAESRLSGTSRESRAPSAGARGKPLPAGPARDGQEGASARAPGSAVDSNPQRPERPAEDAAVRGAVQEAAAEEAAAAEAGAAVLSEDETGDQDETESAAADADPTALLSPPPAPPPPAATAASAGVTEGEGGSGGSKPVAGGLGETAATGQAVKAEAADGSAAAGTAGFAAALDGMQAAAPSPAPAAAGPLTPPGGGSPGALQGAQAAQAPEAAAATPQPTTPPIPLGAVPMTIGLRSLSGMNRFAIRLDPVELGRIDVSLDLDKAGGKARAHLVVDRPETLALLQRDAGSLQQALAQAGFDVGAEAGGIDLSLRDETGSQGGRDGESASRGRSEGGPAGRDDKPVSLDHASLRRSHAVSGLDIRI